MTRWTIAAVIALAACAAHVDGPADDHAARDRALAAELDAQLAILPGVAGARTIVHTPWQDPLAAPAPAGRPTASIALALAPGGDAGRLERDARALAAAALRADPADLTVAVEPSLAAAPSLARVGPFEVAARDRAALAATLVAALAIIAALAGWIAALSIRARRR